MRLAILRPINTVTDTMLQSESEPISSGSSGFSLLTAEMKDFPALEGLAIGGQPAFQTRLVSSVSPFPRQEVRGGFPTSVKTEIRLDGDISFDGRVAGPASDTSASGNNLSLESALLAGSPPSGRAATQLEIAKSSGAIERLIDRTVLPVPLPGLQIRLVKPDDSASAAQRSANDATEGGRSTIGLPNAQAPVPAAPPPLDINAVADKVYQTLQRRHQLERERRGLY
jgi:hypothetical protein